MTRRCLVVPALGLLLAAGSPAAPDEDGADEAALRSAGLRTDGAALLDFFRKRTPREADRARIAELVRQLGSDEFDLREKASQALVAQGAAARKALQGATGSGDPEVARRARDCLRQLAPRRCARRQRGAVPAQDVAGRSRQ